MKNFYEKVLPSQGVYCVTGIHKNGQTRNQFTESVDGVVEIVEKLKGDSNVFVAPNSFEGYSRTSKTAAFSRSFYIDLDVGPTKAYPTKEAADEALTSFREVHQLPPPVRVDSGNGLHAYWVFDSDVPVVEWKPYAEKFKEFCIEQGLQIDPVVSADSARIMRCPDTYNHKNTPPTPTGVIDDVIYTYPFEAFKDFLGEVKASPLDILAVAQKGLDEDTAAVSKHDNFETLFSDIAVKSLSGEGCNQIKYVLENAASLPEPLWHSGLSIARHCTDWETAIHMMSEAYAGYSREETIRKSNETLNKPHSCAVFAERNPGGCEGCPFRGKYTNPLAIGRRLREAPQENPLDLPEWTDSDPVWKEAEQGKQAKFTALPEELRPFARGINGGIYYVPPPSTDKDGKKHQDDPVLLLENDVYPTKRMYSQADGACLWMRHVMPKDPEREFLLPLKNLVSLDDMKRKLAESDILFPQKSAQHVYDYLRKWSTYLQNKETAEIMRMQMGWTEDGRAFVAGLTEITETQGERTAAASPLIRNISKLVKPTGSYDVWKTSAAALNEPGFEMHAFGLLCGFGSPLMHLTSTAGASICFTSADSGVAKTGAMYAGLSVFCDPKEISVLEGNATNNAFIGRFLGLKNIMFGIDEASNVDKQELSNLIHRISQGKAKLRMQSSVNAERELEMTASLIGFFTSNQSLYDKLIALKASPDGEMARLIEFHMKKPPQLAKNSDLGIEIFDKFRFNYGHAGPEFIKYYYGKGEAYARTKVAKWTKRFTLEFGADSAYRFYMNLVGAIFSAGELANEAGILEYDLDRIYNKVISEIIQIRDRTVKLNDTDYKALVSQFYDKHHSGFLIMNEDRVVVEPRSALVGRIVIEDRFIYISCTEFKKYLAELQVSAREFERAVEQEGILIGKEKSRLTTGWRSNIGNPSPIAVYKFRTEIPKEVLSAVE